MSDPTGFNEDDTQSVSETAPRAPMAPQPTPTPQPANAPSTPLEGTQVGFGEPPTHPSAYGLPEHPVPTAQPNQPWYRRPGTIIPILIVVALVVVRLAANTEEQRGAHWAVWVAVGALIISLAVRFGMGGARRQGRNPLRFILIPVVIVIAIIVGVTQHNGTSTQVGVGSCWQTNAQGQVRTISCSSSDASLVAYAQVTSESACAATTGAVGAVEVSGGTYLCLKSR